MSRRLIILIAIPAALASMAGVGAASYFARMGGPPVSMSSPTPTTPEATETTMPPLPPPPPSDPVAELPPPAQETEAPAAERSADAGYDVAAVQQRLADLRYYGGPVDGKEGAATRSAVMAFQKVHGIGVDGVVGPQTLATLESPVTPKLRGGAAHRVEVDLTKQVLYFVQGGELVRIMPVSSGSGSTYRTRGGGRARSLTPVGTYHVQRKIRGLRKAFLGSLYDPMYFYRGWAIHGSNSVPAYPASHGCIRVPRWDAVWLFNRMPVGTQILIHGGVHTFPAGSSAPGTDTPAGDTGGGAAQDEPSASPSPSPTSEPSASPSPSPTSEPSASPSPSSSPSESPEESESESPLLTEPEPSSSAEPEPSASPEPSPSPTPSSSGDPDPQPSGGDGEDASTA